MGETAQHLRLAPVVRLMRLGDIDEVLEVERLAFATPWSRAAFEAELGENVLARYLVLESGGRLVGYGGMWLVLDEAHITNIAIRPEYRGKGLGTALLTAMMDKARAEGASSMTLEVRVSNIRAQRLYAKMGFVAHGLRPGYYSDTGEDAVIMWRERL